MRVTGPNGTALAAAHRQRRGAAAGGGFTLSEANDAASRKARRSRLRTLGGIDALIALQGIEDPLERRRRAVKHGRRALDALDELKLGLLSGTLDQATMLRLKAVAADLKEGSGDEGSIRSWRDRPAGRGGTGQSRNFLNLPSLPVAPGRRRQLPRARAASSLLSPSRTRAIWARLRGGRTRQSVARSRGHEVHAVGEEQERSIRRNIRSRTARASGPSTRSIGRPIESRS